MYSKLAMYLFAIVVFVFLNNCNTGRLGSGSRPTSAPARVSIEIEKVSNSSRTMPGKGRLRIKAYHELALTCINCPSIGVTLPFAAPLKEGARYIYTADFEYQLVTQTEVCTLTISAVGKGSKKVNAVKSYNIYVCPRQGMTEECDTANAVPSCNSIGRR